MLSAGRCIEGPTKHFESYYGAKVNECSQLKFCLETEKMSSFIYSCNEVSSLYSSSMLGKWACSLLTVQIDMWPVLCGTRHCLLRLFTLVYIAFVSVSTNLGINPCSCSYESYASRAPPWLR